jgi:ATP-dependent DNA helicase RecQ
MPDRLKPVLKRYWGYDSFRPLQREAMACCLNGRDSIVVLPTGGGKSLCFQAPAAAMDGLAVVVSPLISLMKDQVDALTECGVPTARFDSSLGAPEKRAVMADLDAGKLKLLYVSPERMVMEGFVERLRGRGVSLIAVDEAHCVSMWGHDFRPEYQQLGFLKDAFPGVGVHAYTATATGQVREDIAEYLRLENPAVLVGSFDRPNLIYRTVHRERLLDQVQAVIARNAGEPGIIYCIRRADVDSLCARLNAEGHRARPYHAGLGDAERKANQEALVADEADIIVATVAFGMGIDKPNVRYVLHTGMPKSLEHYQQESGRAGRDGLEAECCLFYGAGDYGVWNAILGSSAPMAQEIGRAKLNSMYQYCTGVTCRHRALLRYFGQDLDADDCGACDVCLGELDCLPDSTTTARKILSCIARLKERYGGDYTASVLIGSEDERVVQRGHDGLSTHGILSEHPKRAVRDWIEQLVGQGCLERSGAFNVLKLTERGLRVMKGEGEATLLKPALVRGPKSRMRAARKRSPVEDSWEGVDRELYEELRDLRKSTADRRRVPAYVVFNDAALRDMARRRPSSAAGFMQVKGVGEKRCRKYGEQFLTVIRDYCETHSLPMDRRAE